jgi:protein TonB
MSATSLQTSGGGVRRSGFWLRWTISLGLVLVVEGSAILLLYRPVQATHPAQPQVIMMDLGAQPGPPPAPAPAPRVPPAPMAQPRRLASKAPAAQRPAIPDVPPSVSRPELPLPHPPQSPPAAIAQPVRPVPQTSPSAPPTGQVLMTWQGRLITHLARYQRFPAQAQRRGEQGDVMMNVTLSRTGQVLSMAIATTSGHADLDAEAQAWITRAEPLPAFPPEITVQQMELLIPLRFTLQ